MKTSAAVSEISIRSVLDYYSPGPGRHWFDADSRRFFASRVSGSAFEGPGGVYFVSSEHFRPSILRSADTGGRRYSVRRLRASRSIDTHGEFQAFSSRSGAVNAARRAAALLDNTISPRP